MQSDGLNRALSAVVYGDIALTIKKNKYTNKYKYNQVNVLRIAVCNCIAPRGQDNIFPAPQTMYVWPALLCFAALCL